MLVMEDHRSILPKQQSALSPPFLHDPFPPSQIRQLRSILAKWFINYLPTFLGELLVSAGDGGTVIVWHRTERSGLIVGSDEDEDVEEGDETEKWSMRQMLRAADTEDIYDIDFSPDGRFIVVGLTDNSTQVWDLQSGRMVKALKDHRHFVQGVAWDPLNQFVVTQSCDRYYWLPLITLFLSAVLCAVGL